MKITGIRQQAKRSDRYSVFVDEKYAFSLSEAALLEARLASGQELTKERLREYKQLSADDKLYSKALRYAVMRPRSRWELEFYLERKQASPALADIILNKLSNVGLLDDKKFAETFVADRRSLRPASRRKIIAELRKKHVPGDVIEQVVGHEQEDERGALRAVIERKRKQPKYHDDLKLMQYLARQGFGYDDIKTALHGKKEA